MPLVSAVLHTRPGQAARLATALVSEPQLTLGPAQPDRLPIVCDTPSKAADKALWRALKQREDILRIEIIAAHFEDLTLETM